jgi:isopentenyl phosphate kinase
MDFSIIKLGGSLITRKGGRRSLRRSRLERLAGEIAQLVASGRRRLLIGHGSGSFGHVVAAEHGVHRGRGGRDGLAATQAVAAELHGHVLAALRAAGVPAYSVAPSSCIVTDGGRPVAVAAEAVQRALESRLAVVTYGDVVMDRSQRHAICSTETALLALTRRLRRRGGVARRAYWLGDTDGIYDGDGVRIPRLTPAAARRLGAAVGGAGTTDVTGGMRHRLETALAFARLGVESWILDGTEPGTLPAAFTGTCRSGTRLG